MDSKGRVAGAGWNEEAAHGREDIHEPLQTSGWSKAPHRPLSSTLRQVSVLRAVVEPFVRPVFDRGKDLAPGGGRGAQLVRDRPPRWASLFLQKPLQQAFGRFGIAPRLDGFVEEPS